jgi:excisionase family DNA binding protein
MSGVSFQRLLEVNEVAELLNVTKRTVWRWSRLGLLPSIRMPGDIIRWDPEDINKFKTARVVGKL